MMMMRIMKKFSISLGALLIGSLMSMQACLLYTSDAADELDGGDLGGRRIIK